MPNKKTITYKDFDRNARFWQRLRDLSENINDGTWNDAIYNLIVTKRDVCVYADTNGQCKPNRRWKISDVKEYFGIKGNRDRVRDLICWLVEQIKTQDNEEELVCTEWCGTRSLKDA